MCNKKSKRTRVKPAAKVYSCRHRQVTPGTTYLITKKCNDDLFLLLPDDPIVNQVLLYALVIKALKYGILIHAFCFQNNHVHIVATDVRGELPAFMRHFLCESSKALQEARGEKRTVWAKRRYSAVKLLDLDAAERKIAYTVLNPALAGLTEPEDWPGLNSCRWEYGETITAVRPPVYFSKRNRLEHVSIVLTPVGAQYLESQCLDAEHLDETSDNATADELAVAEADVSEANDASCARIQALIDAGLEDVRLEHEQDGTGYRGAERLLEETSREDRGNSPLRELNPRFATRDRELLAAAIDSADVFEVAHARAKKRYCDGHTRVVFPAGTYGYRVTLGVRVAEGRAAA